MSTNSERPGCQPGTAQEMLGCEQQHTGRPLPAGYIEARRCLPRTRYTPTRVGPKNYPSGRSRPRYVTRGELDDLVARVDKLEAAS
jgi:hypothetical protein